MWRRCHGVRQGYLLLEGNISSLSQFSLDIRSTPRIVSETSEAGDIEVGFSTFNLETEMKKSTALIAAALAVTPAFAEQPTPFLSTGLVTALKVVKISSYTNGGRHFIWFSLNGAHHWCSGAAPHVHYFDEGGPGSQYAFGLLLSALTLNRSVDVVFNTATPCEIVEVYLH